MYTQIKQNIENHFNGYDSNIHHQMSNHEDDMVKKRLEIRHNAFLNVFKSNLIVSMLRNRRQEINQIDRHDEMDSIYRLSAIDLFVEKAIVVLESEAKKYQIWGKIAIITATIPILIGIYVAGHNYLNNSIPNKPIQPYNLDKQNIFTVIEKDKNHSISHENLKILLDREIELSWQYSLVMFVQSFTFYGLLVLATVLCMRFGKSFIDQAERLFNRRHALREGRLYLHLQNGKVGSVEEFDKVFNWNTSQDNAFATITTDAQAPWGTALKEALNIIPKTVEAAKTK